MIKNVVFDLGNVLIKFSPIEFLRERYKDEEIIEAIYETIFCSEEWPKLDRGIITEVEAENRFCLKNPKYDKYIREVMQSWYDMLVPIEGTVSIYNEIKDKGYKMYILSNYHRKAFEITYKNNEFLSKADGIVVSHELNMLKPEPEIYDYLLKKYSLKAEETLFIDDTLINIEGARKAGIDTIHFTDGNALRKSLERYYIL